MCQFASTSCNSYTDLGIWFPMYMWIMQASSVNKLSERVYLHTNTQSACTCIAWVCKYHMHNINIYIYLYFWWLQICNDTLYTGKQESLPIDYWTATVCDATHHRCNSRDAFDFSIKARKSLQDTDLGTIPDPTHQRLSKKEINSRNIISDILPLLSEHLLSWEWNLLYIIDSWSSDIFRYTPKKKNMGSPKNDELLKMSFEFSIRDDEKISDSCC